MFTVSRLTVLDGSKTAYLVYYLFKVYFNDAVIISDYITSKFMVVSLFCFLGFTTHCGCIFTAR